MRLTLCVKNCFGCVNGWHKALLHATHGQTTELFASCIAKLYTMLAPTIGVCDGIEAMHKTGPAKGAPYKLGLVGASNDAIALDEAIITALKRDISEIPIAALLAKHPQNNIFYPMLKPQDINSQGFILPQDLKPASFAPMQLLKSLVKRFILEYKKPN